MGSLCSCFRIPDAEENVGSNSSNDGNCMCPNCFIKNLRNKYGALFSRTEMHATQSFQGTATSSSTVAPHNTESHTSRHMPYDVNTETMQLQNDFEDMEHGKGTSHSHLEPQPVVRSVQIWAKNSSGVDKQDSSYYEDAKQSFSESSGDEDVCPTCLEEYTLENPKIITQCRHHYHLCCIYEWMERSEKCPICGKVSKFSVE